MLPPDLAAELRAAFDDDRDADTFLLRLERYGPEAEGLLRAVYGDAARAMLLGLLEPLLHAYHARPADLKRLDEARLLRPDWWQQPERLGYVADVRRFAGTLGGVGERLEYLGRLGVDTLHLTSLLRGKGDDPATQDYRAVRDGLGTLDDLSALARQMRGRGLGLMLDLDLGAVSREHDWARRARAGDPAYREYFHIRPGGPSPEASGWVWEEALGGWVQTRGPAGWAVNWDHPAVFREYLDILLFLANRGVTGFQLDGRPEGRPGREVLGALRACTLVAAPAITFKFGTTFSLRGGVAHLPGQQPDLADHAALTLGLWDALATQDTRALAAALAVSKPAQATWALALGSHREPGWNFGADGHPHGPFLSEFYSGELSGSFGCGVRQRGANRVCGTAASLAGLQQAFERWDSVALDEALARLTLLHTALLGFGGLPLLSMGDELGLLTPDMDWALVESAQRDPTLPAARLGARLRWLVQVRRRTPQLHASVESKPVESSDSRLLLLRREHPRTLVQVYNFSPHPLTWDAGPLRPWLVGRATDLLSGAAHDLGSPDPERTKLEPYGALWLLEVPE